MKITSPYCALIAAIVWIVTAFLLHPSPRHLKWGVMLFLLAPLVLVPLAMRLAAPETREGLDARLWRWASLIQLPAALLLVPAFIMQPGLLAGLLSTPWLVVTAMISASGILSMYQRRVWSLEELSINLGKFYLVTGGIWAVLSRLGVRPINFDSVIVLLTAMHFHYAGFLLALMTGLAGRLLRTRLARLAALGVILGMPLTAFGITTSQIGLGHAPELLAVIITAIAGLMAAGLHLQLATQRKGRRLVRICWLIAGVSLAFSMVLAIIYGSRFYYPIEWLDIPLMRALHGSANGLGFGLIGMVGWYLHIATDDALIR